MLFVVFFQIFKIERDGEKKRYKPFKELPNRKLLWHGSRTTNFAGILSQGLRIAPPEAPVVSSILSKLVFKLFADAGREASWINEGQTINNHGTVLILLYLPLSLSSYQCSLFSNCLDRLHVRERNLFCR